MINEYKGIINNLIVNSYSEILVIDVMEDKLYKYLIKNGDVSFLEEMSYMNYLNKCKEFIYEDDIDSYIDSLSLSKLESSNGKISLSYKMKDIKLDTYREYMNSINLYNYDGEELLSDYDYISLHDNVIAYVKSKRLYLLRRTAF